MYENVRTVNRVGSEYCVKNCLQRRIEEILLTKQGCAEGDGNGSILQRGRGCSLKACRPVHGPC